MADLLRMRRSDATPYAGLAPKVVDIAWKIAKVPLWLIGLPAGSPVLWGFLPGARRVGHRGVVSRFVERVATSAKAPKHTRFADAVKSGDGTLLALRGRVRTRTALAPDPVAKNPVAFRRSDLVVKTRVTDRSKPVTAYTSFLVHEEANDFLLEDPDGASPAFLVRVADAYLVAAEPWRYRRGAKRWSSALPPELLMRHVQSIRYGTREVADGDLVDVVGVRQSIADPTIPAAGRETPIRPVLAATHGRPLVLRPV